MKERYTFSSSCEREDSECLCSHEYELTQAAKDLAYETLLNDVARPNGEALNHALRTVDIAALFAHGKCNKIPPSLTEAALLHDLCGRMTKDIPGVREMKRKVVAYVVDDTISEEEKAIRRHAFDIMNDQVRIGEAARAYRNDANWLTDGDGGDFLPFLKNVLTNKYDVYKDNLLPEVWKTTAPNIYWKEMADLTDTVNVESLIVKGAEMMDNIKHPAKYDGARLRDILEAESFYIPLLEVLGYDAMAMELASSCKIRRLIGQGKHEELAEAERIYRAAEKIDPAVVAQKMFNLDTVPEMSWVINESSEDYEKGINCRFGEMKINLNGKETRVKFRQKSIGSLAHKLANKKEDYRVMDVFGFSIITGDEAHGDFLYHEMSDEEVAVRYDEQLQRLVDAYGLIVRMAQHSDSVHFTPTTPKRPPIYFQGDQAFIDAFRREPMMFNGLADGQICPNIINKDNVYRVAKYTAEVDGDDGGISAEVQFLTSFDHQLAKIGTTNHGIYKSGKKEDLRRKELMRILDYIRKMHERRVFFGHPRCYDVSKRLGKLALEKIKQSILE